MQNGLKHLAVFLLVVIFIGTVFVSVDPTILGKVSFKPNLNAMQRKQPDDNPYLQPIQFVELYPQENAFPPSEVTFSYSLDNPNDLEVDTEWIVDSTRIHSEELTIYVDESTEVILHVYSEVNNLSHVYVITVVQPDESEKDSDADENNEPTPDREPFDKSKLPTPDENAAEHAADRRPIEVAPGQTDDSQKDKSKTALGGQRKFKPSPKKAKEAIDSYYMGSTSAVDLVNELRKWIE